MSSTNVFLAASIPGNGIDSTDCLSDNHSNVPMLLFLPAFAFQTFLSLLDVGEREPPSSSSPTPFQRSSSQSVSLGVNPNSLTRSLTQFCFWRVLQSVSREYAWKVVPHSVRNFMEETLKPSLSLSHSWCTFLHFISILLLFV